jgi:hypothetical protein
VQGLPVRLTQKLEKIDSQVAQLLKFKVALLGMRQACNGECGTPGGVPACVPQGAALPRTSKCC